MHVDAGRWHRLLVSQDGVVTTAQALSCGFSASAVHHRVRAGDWQRLARGVLLTVSGTATPRQRCTAALLLGGPAAALTGSSACRAHMLQAAPADHRVHVAVPRDVRTPASGLWVPHRTTRPYAITRVAGLPTVAPARAVVDAVLLLRDLGRVRALVAEAVQRGRCSVDQLQAELARAPQNGSGHLRTALQEVEAGARSRPEAVLLRALRALAGLPAFELNVDVRSAAGVWLARPDVVFKAQRLVVEVDGQAWHLSPDRWASDVERHTRMEAAGWTVLRYPAARVLADPAGVAREVAAVAARLCAA
jgi:hypothetical protein